MTEKKLPESIDPFRHAEQGLGLSGTVDLAEMHRIANILNTLSGEAKVELEFGRDEQKIANIKGQLAATVSLQCQRCMDPYVYEIIASFHLGVVHTLEEANALPSHYEPAIVDDGQLKLHDLVEDELILSLPIIPRHAEDECSVKHPVQDVGIENERKGPNPFHVLETLKEKQKS